MEVDDIETASVMDNNEVEFRSQSIQINCSTPLITVPIMRTSKYQQ